MYRRAVRGSGNAARDTAVQVERAAGKLDDLIVRSLTLTWYMHRCAIVAPRLIGTDQKCAKCNVELERDEELPDTEALAAATGVSGQAQTDGRKRRDEGCERTSRKVFRTVELSFQRWRMHICISSWGGETGDNNFVEEGTGLAQVLPTLQPWHWCKVLKTHIRRPTTCLYRR